MGTRAQMTSSFCRNPDRKAVKSLRNGEFSEPTAVGKDEVTSSNLVSSSTKARFQKKSGFLVLKK
ncbi:MAG: hypothetical protein PUB32_08600 [Clostridiales bacterium]|nr:hypothetical protein [Clostridiales bacterium]